MGYDKYEVNKFVAEVTNNYENILERLKKSDDEIIKLKEELENAKSGQVGWTRAFIAAEEASSQIRRAAKDESEAIIQDAKKNASRIINDALIRAETTENETRELRKIVDSYKRKVKEIIKEHEEMIDEMGDVKY